MIARLREPLFGPEYEWEKNGHVNKIVVFPTGTVIEGNSLNIYYGCADTRIGLAQINLEELIEKLIKN